MAYEFHIPDLEWYGTINAGLMARAIGNLINNSIKYAGPGTLVKLCAELTADGELAVTIEDNGPGIPPDAQTQVFLPFYRADASRSSRTGGTGLGLAISKAIIEKNRGTLTLDTDHTPGCRFRIVLPLIDAPGKIR
jgi:signal transduction histidine kinase